MAKPRHYVCQSCGASYPRWAGRCEACGAWNTHRRGGGARGRTPSGLARQGRPQARVRRSRRRNGRGAAARRVTGIAEFDRVTGGGLVPRLGAPGRRRSRHRQVDPAAAGRPPGAARRLAAGARRLYLRRGGDRRRCGCAPQRLGLATPPVQLAAATNVRDILATLDRADAPRHRRHRFDPDHVCRQPRCGARHGRPGARRAAELIRFAKRRGIALLLVGHVTKDGQIAGPRVLEHMVDAVLYFEGERGHQFRILRAVKNRFGPTDEIGVFEMTDGGLVEVANPSALFLAERRGDVSGAAVFAGIEGTRPVLVEIQALVAPSPLGTPRRAVVGWDSGRLAMMLAVLEARCGLVICRPRRLSQRRRRPADRRAGRRSRGGGGADLLALGPARAARSGVLRRDRACAARCGR